MLFIIFVTKEKHCAGTGGGEFFLLYPVRGVEGE